MFRATIKSEILKEIVDVISTLVDEAKFNISKGSINSKAVDPAHVAMVEVEVKKSAFEEYKATDCELGINIGKLKEVLKLARPGDPLQMEHDEDKNRMVIKVENITRRMPLVDTAGMSDPKVPNLNLPAKVVINVSELRQGIKASEAVSDHVALTASTDKFEMVSEGDTDSVNLTIPKDLLKELDCKETYRSLYSLDYFSNMVKSVGGVSEVTMHLGNDYPVSLEFTIADGKGHVSYLLAPRIESD